VECVFFLEQQRCVTPSVVNVENLILLSLKELPLLPSQLLFFVYGLAGQPALPRWCPARAAGLRGGLMRVSGLKR